MINLTEIQRHFINTACNIKDYIYDFAEEDNYFLEVYGFDRQAAFNEISDLQQNVKQYDEGFLKHVFNAGKRYGQCNGDNWETFKAKINE